MKFICEFCGKEFERGKYQANRSKHKYCSKECSAKAKNQKVEKVCIVCGNKYFVHPNRAKKTKTCSKSCRGRLERQAKANEIIIKQTHAEIIINSKKYGTKITLIDIEDIEKCKKYTWYLCWDKRMSTPYVTTKIRKDFRQSRRSQLKLHRFVTNCPDNLVVDHINHNTLDNRKNNLKVCTQFENVKNNKNNTSGHVGVYWAKHIDKWIAKIHIKGKPQHIGTFKTFEEAVIAREQEEEKLSTINN